MTSPDATYAGMTRGILQRCCPLLCVELSLVQRYSITYPDVPGITPAHAGVQWLQGSLDSGCRRNDEGEHVTHFGHVFVTSCTKYRSTAFCDLCPLASPQRTPGSRRFLDAGVRRHDMGEHPTHVGYRFVTSCT